MTDRAISTLTWFMSGIPPKDEWHIFAFAVTLEDLRKQTK